MNANDLFKAVMELDLEPIKTKLMHVQSGEGWSPEKTSAVEKEYRRFLCLMKLYPNEDTAPLVDVDTFWHYHILDTMKYATDCEQVFGYFLHHYPYVGMRGANDEEFRIDSGMRMRDLYEATFGDAYPVLGFQDAGVRLQGFRFGPEVRMLDGRAGSASANTAYCGGPESARTGVRMLAGFAYCGGPEQRVAGARAAAAATAYCGGPETKSVTYRLAGTAVAYCGGPEIGRLAGRSGSISANTAYCGGPERSLGGATAYCGGPERSLASATAYCGGPERSLATATAYCGGPERPVAANTAYCGGPESANAAKAGVAPQALAA
jgi:hypothetical protein